MIEGVSIRVMNNVKPNDDRKTMIPMRMKLSVPACDGQWGEVIAQNVMVMLMAIAMDSPSLMNRPSI